MIKITNTIPKIVGIYNYNKRNDRYLKKKKKKNKQTKRNARDISTFTIFSKQTYISLITKTYFKH